MMTPYRKKLIEVALPLEAINAESAREKSIRHGHPSTLHLWWARRPLAACRAVLFASLVDDPDSDPHYLKPNGSLDKDAAGLKRADLFNLIEELVMWENSNNPQVIRTARAEIARCVASRLIETGVLKKDTEVGVPALAGEDDSHTSPTHTSPTRQRGRTTLTENERPAKAGTPAGTPTVTAYDLVKRGHCRPIATGLDKKVGRVRFSFDVSELPPEESVNAFLAEHAPPVLDPFCGGGSIPLEAQRLGLRAYASDLNPVPVLINKALIEIPPKFAGRPPVNPDWQKKSKEEKAAKLWHVRRALPRTSATTASGCATRPRNASATSIPRSKSPPKWPKTDPILKPTSDRNSPSLLGFGPEPSPHRTRPQKVFKFHLCAHFGFRRRKAGRRRRGQLLIKEQFRGGLKWASENRRPILSQVLAQLAARVDAVSLPTSR